MAQNNVEVAVQRVARECLTAGVGLKPQIRHKDAAETRTDQHETSIDARKITLARGVGGNERGGAKLMSKSLYIAPRRGQHLHPAKRPSDSKISKSVCDKWGH